MVGRIGDEGSGGKVSAVQRREKSRGEQSGVECSVTAG